MQRNQAIDLAVRDPFVIIEAKNLPRDAVHEQLRHAVGQLYEYRFFNCAKPGAQLLFLGSHPLSDRWLHYLEEDRDIAVAWWSSEHFELSPRASTTLGIEAPGLRGTSRS